MSRKKLSEDEKYEIWKLCEGRCHLCNKKWNLNDYGDWNADHMVPYSDGGLMEVINLRVACGATSKNQCNQKRGIKYLNYMYLLLTFSGNATIFQYEKETYGVALCQGVLQDRSLCANRVAIGNKKYCKIHSQYESMVVNEGIELNDIMI
jgi:hypothetical protein